MRDLGSLEITEERAFFNWLASLAGADLMAWQQDIRELASLIGLDLSSPSWSSDPARSYPFQYLSMQIWMLHEMGYPLPVLQSLREGKGPGSQP